jgi:hypothetical protein
VVHVKKERKHEPEHFKTKSAGGAMRPTATSPWRRDNQVVQAASAPPPCAASTHQLGAEAAGDPVDIAKGGLPEVTLGGIVAAGDPLTADANGKAIKAEPAAGSNVRIVGFAEVAGIAGDRIPFQFAPGVMQG